MSKPREFWTNEMSMEDSLSDAKDFWPRAEWEDLQCYVLKSDYKKVVADVAMLTTEIKRMLDANYTSLLLCTAWMGIPDKKREDWIEEHLSNAKFICEKALKQLNDSEGGK